MFDFLKRFFPKKGESMEDLDDDMYASETEDPVEDDEPTQSTGYKVEGLLMDFIRKFRKDSLQDDSPAFPVLSGDREEETPSSDGLLGRLNNLEGTPKYVFLGVITVFLISSVYGGVYLFRSSGNSGNGRRSQSPQVQQTRETQKETPANPMLASVANASIMENPFMETTPVLQDVPASARQMEIPSFSSSPRIPSAAITTMPTMPVIPSNPRPEIPASAKQIPAIPPGSSGSPAPMGGGNSSIQGVITSSNPNDNIAIMGDGSVVSVGETFRDGRIAYIGGDGITFEDGSKMNMQQP